MSYNQNDKVVCIDDNFNGVILNDRYRFTGVMPVKDSVYVIEKIMTDAEGCLGFRLTGTTAFCNVLGVEHEVGYRAIRFRKLEDVKNSVPRVEAIGDHVLVPVHSPAKHL